MVTGRAGSSGRDRSGAGSFATFVIAFARAIARALSAAGVSAGTDLGFYLVSRLAGRAVAENAALAAEYDWHRDPELPIWFPPYVKT